MALEAVCCLDYCPGPTQLAELPFRPIAQATGYVSIGSCASADAGRTIMKLGRYLYAGSLLAALVVSLGLWNPLTTARGDGGHGDDKDKLKFRVDPFWPKPMPAPADAKGVAHTWVLGEVA